VVCCHPEEARSADEGSRVFITPKEKIFFKNLISQKKSPPQANFLIAQINFPIAKRQGSQLK
jgi:hypothetical protein